MPNRLAAERSPYLLQHADNPVDWRPWSEEAFEAARAGDKPVFLSIGYSTCHWCHVMEHESFENEHIAAVLNRDFVPIKVDREERPDVDRVYMTFVQATTGSGGWPMSVFLTPDLKPFFGGTYFPPDSRWGRPGFVDVLTEIARAWREERPRIDQIADTLTARLKEMASATAGSAERGVPGTDVLAEGVREYAATFDPQFGGFGTAPKFPRPSELLFLMRETARTGDDRAKQMVVETLRAMAFGGMRDHVGGGFHRYSVDREWRVPHFEKMLYDQAQLALAYLEAAQLTGDAFYAIVAEDTLEYVRREMTDAQGGFYSAEDADSVPPEQAEAPDARKSEGAFYLWTAAELDALLGADAEVVRLRFGIRPEGNAPEDPHGEFTGKNLLYTAMAVEEIAARTGRGANDIVDVLARARVQMFTARSARPRPHLDDKVLTAWNGLMIAAFARAARVRPDSPRAVDYLAAAGRAATFIRSTMWREGALLRSYREGHAGIDGYCEDYACLVAGLLELVQADGDPSWLSWAIEVQRAQDARFWDDEGGGWFNTTGQDPLVVLRLKEDYDGAEPSASSVSAINLLMLDHLIGPADNEHRVERALARLHARGRDAGRVAPLMMAALSMYHAGLSQLVIAGDDIRQLSGVAAAHYLPFTTIVPVAPGAREELRKLLPFIEPMGREPRATAYLCRDFVCEVPTSDPAALGHSLNKIRDER